MTTPTVDPYPEHTKQAKVVDQAHAAGEFLEWAESRGLHLMQRSEHGYGAPTKSWIGLLAEWLGIDLTVIEQEKRAMLARMKEMNKQ